MQTLFSLPPSCLSLPCALSPFSHSRYLCHPEPAKRGTPLSAGHCGVPSSATAVHADLAACLAPHARWRSFALRASLTSSTSSQFGSSPSLSSRHHSWAWRDSVALHLYKVHSGTVSCRAWNAGSPNMWCLHTGSCVATLTATHSSQPWVEPRMLGLVAAAMTEGCKGTVEVMHQVCSRRTVKEHVPGGCVAAGCWHKEGMRALRTRDSRKPRPPRSHSCRPPHEWCSGSTAWPAGRICVTGRVSCKHGHACHHRSDSACDTHRGPEGLGSRVWGLRSWGSLKTRTWLNPRVLHARWRAIPGQGQIGGRKLAKPPPLGLLCRRGLKTECSSAPERTIGLCRGMAAAWLSSAKVRHPQGSQIKPETSLCTPAKQARLRKHHTAPAAESQCGSGP